MGYHQNPSICTLESLECAEREKIIEGLACKVILESYYGKRKFMKHIKFIIVTIKNDIQHDIVIVTHSTQSIKKDSAQEKQRIAIRGSPIRLTSVFTGNTTNLERMEKRYRS